MPVLLLHGVPDTHRVWDELLPHLGRDDVLTPDLPGFGADPGPGEPTKEAYLAWLVGALEAIGEPVDLVGHDWGCILAVRAATARPDLVRTLACGSGPVDETYVWHEAAQLWQTPEVGEQVMTAITPETMPAAFEASGLTAAQAAIAAAGIHEEMKRCILGLYRSACHVGEEWAGDLVGFPRPALVLWGGDDVPAPPAFAHRMADRLGGRAVVFEGGHHWWPLSHPAEVAAELQALWAEGG